jgi:hypothetical protein
LFGKRLSEAEFRAPLFYRRIRHPIYLGVLLAIWATTAMTAGHLLFAVEITGCILIGIQLEEHDLIQQFGDQYRRYRQRAAMLVPLPGRKFTEHRPPAQGASGYGSMNQEKEGIALKAPGMNYFTQGLAM